MTQGKKKSILPLLASIAATLPPLFAFVWFLPAMPALPEFHPQGTGLSFLREADLPKEERDIIAIYDYSPIFLNTPLNYSDFDLKIPNIGLAGASEYSPDPVVKTLLAGVSASDNPDLGLHSLMASGAYSNFMFKDADAKIPAMPKTFYARASVTESYPEKILFEDKFEIDAPWAGNLWYPVEFSVIVSRDGAWSAPFLQSSSGVEALDAKLDAYVRSNLYRMNLPYGYHIITIFP